MELPLSLYEPPSVRGFDLEIALDDESALEISECLQRVQELPAVQDDTTLGLCIEAGKEIKTLLDGIEQSREGLKRPFLAACRTIDGYAKKARKSLEDAYQDVMSAIAIFEGKRRAQREEEKRRLNAEVEQKALEAFKAQDKAQKEMLLDQARDAAIAANKVIEPVAGMALVKTYKFEIEDLDAVWNFNRRLLKIELSQSACLDLIRAMKDSGAKEYKIPGVRITEIVGARVSGR